MEEKIEIMNLLQNKQFLEKELKVLAYGAVEIRENNSNKYIYVHYTISGIFIHVFADRTNRVFVFLCFFADCIIFYYCAVSDDLSEVQPFVG